MLKRLCKKLFKKLCGIPHIFGGFSGLIILLILFFLLVLQLI